MLSDQDTIFALSSGSLPSGVAVVRLSGPRAIDVNQKLTGKTAAARQASLRSIFDNDGNTVDQAIVLSFPKPNSFTGEDVVEWHCHGGIATVQAVLDLLGQQDSCRMAEAGEFSRRAFENGKMDLTQLEGLSDLISAQTEQQRKQALAQSGGSLRSLYEGWRGQFVRCRALIEAELDFSDEEDIPGSVSDQVWSQVSELKKEIRNHLSDQNRGQIVREGYKVALTGKPNAGKSSLLNALAKREVAIVTEQAGTTRDVLEVSLDIDGQLVQLFDTAGIRSSDDIVEQEGIRRAHRAANDADLVLWLAAPQSEGESPEFDNAVVVHSQSDLNPGFEDGLQVSVVLENGLDDLLAFLKNRLSEFRASGEQPVVSRARQREHLEQTERYLDEALSDNTEIELRSESLRLAGDSLGRITGRIDVEDLLDVIFSEFCVGK